MVRTSTFSIRLTSEVRKMIEKHAKILRMKPSVLAAMILSDCTESWVEDYSVHIYNMIKGGIKHE